MLNSPKRFISSFFFSTIPTALFLCDNKKRKGNTCCMLAEPKKSHLNTIRTLPEEVFNKIFEFVPWFDLKKYAFIRFSFWNTGNHISKILKRIYMKQVDSLNYMFSECSGNCVIGHIDGHVESYVQVGCSETRTVIPNLKKIIKVVCESQHTLVLSSDGDLLFLCCVYPFSSKVNPKPVKFFLDKKVIDCWGFCCHFVAKTSDGKIWVWGHNDSGQLGLGYKKGVVSVDKPKHLSFFKNILKEAALGLRHTLFLDKFGYMYGCGDNSCGQLGMSHTQELDSSLPKLIKNENKVFENEKIKAISCGKKYSVCLSVNGKVFTFGDSSILSLFGRTSLYGIPIISNIGHITNISCHQEGFTMLNKSKEVFVLGNISGYRSLGLPRIPHAELTNWVHNPKRVETDLEIVSISGKLICDTDGKVYEIQIRAPTGTIYPRYIGSIK